MEGHSTKKNRHLRKDKAVEIKKIRLLLTTANTWVQRINWRTFLRSRVLNTVLGPNPAKHRFQAGQTQEKTWKKADF